MIGQIQDVDIERIYEFMQCKENAHLFDPCKDQEDIITITILKENLYSQLENTQDLSMFLPKTHEECSLISGKQPQSGSLIQAQNGSLIQLGLIAYTLEIQTLEVLIALMMLSLKDKNVSINFEKARDLFIEKMHHQKQSFSFYTKILKFVQKARGDFFENCSGGILAFLADKVFFEAYRLMFVPPAYTNKDFEIAQKELETKLEQTFELASKKFSEKTDTLLQSKRPGQFFLNVLDLVDFQISTNRRCVVLRECYSFQLFKQKEDYINSRFRRVCIFFTCELGVACLKHCVYSLLYPF